MQRCTAKAKRIKAECKAEAKRIKNECAAKAKIGKDQELKRNAKIRIEKLPIECAKSKNFSL